MPSVWSQIISTWILVSPTADLWSTLFPWQELACSTLGCFCSYSPASSHTLLISLLYQVATKWSIQLLPFIGVTLLYSKLGITNHPYLFWCTIIIHSHQHLYLRLSTNWKWWPLKVISHSKLQVSFISSLSSSSDSSSGEHEQSTKQNPRRHHFHTNSEEVLLLLWISFSVALSTLEFQYFQE